MSSVVQSYYELKVKPSKMPIEYSEAADWCRDIDISDRGIINSLIVAATELIENMTNRCFVDRTFAAYFSDFSYSDYESKPFVELGKSPFSAFAGVGSVKINDLLLDASEYKIKKKNGYSRLLFESQDLDSDFPYPIEVNFIVGYGSDIPEMAIAAIKQLVLFWYENRGDVSANKNQRMPNTINPMIKNLRISNSVG